jgi:hypothetical protein
MCVDGIVRGTYGHVPLVFESGSFQVVKTGLHHLAKPPIVNDAFCGERSEKNHVHLFSATHVTKK